MRLTRQILRYFGKLSITANGINQLAVYTKLVETCLWKCPGG